MPITKKEITFGGLFNSKDDSKTPEGRAYAMQNCDVDGEIAKCRKGYSNLALGVTPTAGYGVGYGKYGSDEEYVAVLTVGGTTQAYRINPTTHAATAISGTLTASDWYFAWYASRLFYANETDGVRYRTIGAATSSGTLTGPTTAPTIDYKTSSASYNTDFTGSTFAYSGWGSNPTGTVSNTYNCKFVMTAAITDPRRVTITITLGTDKDWTYRDFGGIVLTTNVDGANQIEIDTTDVIVDVINADGSPVTIEPNYYGSGTVSGSVPRSVFRDFQFADEKRTSRDNIHKLEVTFTITQALNGKAIYLAWHMGDNWPNDSDTLFVDDGPTNDTIEYAYSWWDDSAAVETELSPVKKTASTPITGWGSYQNITGTQATGGAWDTSGGTADRIYFYRKEKATGIWRRVGTASNSSSTPNLDEHYMEHELADLTEFPGLNLPASIKISAIGVWKQCLVLGENDSANNRVGLAYISFVGKPFRYLPPPDNASEEPPDEEDLSRGRTVFVADNRAEKIHGIHGQDSLYFVTPYSCYAMVGDLPATATPPRRLPGSRGSVGTRASCGYGGGILVGSQDGLWFYAVGRGFSGEDNGSLVERELTQDARQSWKTLLGTDSSVWGNLTIFEFNDEIWCVLNTRYLKLTRNNNWVEGTFADAIEAAVPVRDLGIRWLRQAGKWDRVEDNGAGTDYTTDDGTAINWTYTTGVIDPPRSRIKGYEVRGDGTPTLALTIYDGAITNSKTYNTITCESFKVMTFPTEAIEPSWRYKLTVGGNSSSSIETLHLWTDKAEAALGG